MKASSHFIAGLTGLILLSADGTLAGEPGRFPVDLDRDGRAETISWAQFDETEAEGEFYQLRVLDDDGASVLWEGPRSHDLANPFVIGRWHFGISLPELAADIDADGNVELIIPTPISDVSPVSFKVLRWSGRDFQIVRYGALLEKGNKTGNYPWSSSDSTTGTWISGFDGVDRDGRIKVYLLSYYGGANAGHGTALVKPTRDGFQVSEWIKPIVLSNTSPPPPSVVITNPNMPTTSQPTPNKTYPGAKVSSGNNYRARLSNRDHFNSKGQQLESVIQVLRQDRVYYHQGKGDPEDGPDATFGTFQGRNIMEDLQPAPVSMSRAAWERTILTQTPLVDISVSGRTIFVKILEPDSAGVTRPNMPNVIPPGGQVAARNEYRARLGNQDHFSSTGERLQSVIQVLRQDRANYHRGKGDPEDGPDATFGTFQGRNIMEDLQPAPVGMSRKTWERTILNQTPLVNVRVSGMTIFVEIMD